MNILVISQYFYPEDFRINDICIELRNRGNNVTVLTGIPNYPVGDVFPGYEDSWKQIQVWNGIRVIRCNNLPRKKGLFNLLKNYVSFVKKANSNLGVVGDRFDVIYVYQLSPITMAIPAIKYKKKHNIPIYMYVLDIWPESVREISSSRILGVHNPIYLVAKFISRKIYGCADAIGVKCCEFADYLVDVCHVDREKCFLLQEHAESGYLEISHKPIDNNCIDFMFLGNIGHSSNCEIILEAAKGLQATNDYKIHFVGEGSELENLKNISQKYNLSSRVIFHGRHPQKEINKFYEMADVCILTLANTTAIGLTPPAKMSGYMAAARPIIGAINGAAKRIVTDAECGVLVDADDVIGLRNVMQEIIDAPESIKEMGSNGREYFVNNLRLEQHINELEQQIKCIIKSDL